MAKEFTPRSQFSSMRQYQPSRKPRKQRYRYYLTNKATGLGVKEPFCRVIYAYDDSDATALVRELRPCFGAETKIVKLVRLVPKQKDMFDDAA